MTVQEVLRTLPEAGVLGHVANITSGGLEDKAGRDRQLVLSYITSYMPTPCMSKVTSHPDVCGLAIESRKAGRHDGCILEGLVFSILLCSRARDGERLDKCPQLSVM